MFLNERSDYLLGEHSLGSEVRGKIDELIQRGITGINKGKHREHEDGQTRKTRKNPVKAVVNHMQSHRDPKLTTDGLEVSNFSNRTRIRTTISYFLELKPRTGSRSNELEFELRYKVRELFEHFEFFRSPK